MSLEDTLTAPDAGTELDLRGDLSAAFDQFEASDAGTVQPPAANAQPGERPASAPVTPQTPEQTAAAAQRARDEQGRFAKPGEAAQKPSTIATTPQAPAEPGQAQTIAPPPSWSATAKSKFATLDPEIQQEVLRREKDIEQGKAQWDQKAEHYNRLDAILAPRREQFALAGLDDARAVQTLFAAQDFLQRDPAGALIYLGRQAGVNWQGLFQRLQGAPQQTQPQVPPGMEPVIRQVQSLTQSFEQQQRAARDAQVQGHLATVQTFAADPKNIYFENVKQAMGDMIRSGRAANLADAYDRACWEDPTIRPLMMQATEQQRQAEAKAQAAQRAAQARHASGSVTGSPTPGASPNGPASKGTVRDDLSAAWDAAQ